MPQIGIVILATNSYYILGIRFIKKFLYHYKGKSNIVFYFFSDKSPHHALAENTNIRYYYVTNNSWVEGTNMKFKNILSLESIPCDYLYYFDADTNITKDFDETWFLGDIVGGEHFGNRSFLKDGAGFDRNPISKAYVPLDSPLPYTYYYGAFFGGKKEKVIEMCKILRENQIEDKKIPYEPPVNDESYINQYFHTNPPHTVSTENFMFDISDKGGLGETRNTRLDISTMLKEIETRPNKVFDIRNNKIIWL